MTSVWGVAVIGFIAFVFLFVYIAAAIRIVRPYEKGVVERLGKYQRTYEPGLHIIIPFLDRITKVDMRENVVDVPPQEVITKDNVVVTVDAVVYYEATDPVKLIYNVANFYLAATKLAQTNLRNVIGEMQLDESLTCREKINAALRQILDDATDKWGVRVVRVELQRIEPPVDVTEAMHRQMKAERTKRALILEADGDKQAAITRAEGSKQSAILEAEGQATAIKEVADAEKFQRIAVAEGEAEAIEQRLARDPRGRPDQRPDRDQVPRVAREPSRTGARTRSSCRWRSRGSWARSAASPSCSRTAVTPRRTRMTRPILPGALPRPRSPGSRHQDSMSALHATPAASVLPVPRLRRAPRVVRTARGELTCRRLRAGQRRRHDRITREERHGGQQRRQAGDSNGPEGDNVGLLRAGDRSDNHPGVRVLLGDARSKHPGRVLGVHLRMEHALHRPVREHGGTHQHQRRVRQLERTDSDRRIRCAGVACRNGARLDLARSWRGSQSKYDPCAAAARAGAYHRSTGGGRAASDLPSSDACGSSRGGPGGKQRPCANGSDRG